MVNGHIKRWWFLYKVFSTLLDPDQIEDLIPTDFGWTLEDGELLPLRTLTYSLIVYVKHVLVKKGVQTIGAHALKGTPSVLNFVIVVIVKTNKTMYFSG